MIDVTATDMVYTSVYIDPDGEDRLVIHTPYFESEVPSVIALKSFRFEKVEGCVIGAPLRVVQAMESKLQEFERNKKNFKFSDLLEFLRQLGVSIRYIQSPDHPRAPKDPKQIQLSKESNDDTHRSEDKDGT